VILRSVARRTIRDIMISYARRTIRDIMISVYVSVRQHTSDRGFDTHHGGGVVEADETGRGNFVGCITY
jgi:hypothetical protein